MHWKTIDTAPTDGTWITLYAPHDSHRPELTVWFAKYRDGDWIDMMDDVIMPFDEATHWAPVPEPPIPIVFYQ